MKTQKTKILFAAVLLSALVLSACGAPSGAAATQAVNAVYTVAAQTIEAKASQATSTPQPTATLEPSSTPAATDTPAATASPTAAPATATSALQNFCDNSLFIADVTIPDHTVLKPGETFEKTWTFKNIGTCTWTQSYGVVFSNGDSKFNYENTTINQTVEPQKQANITIHLTAPTKTGDYMSWFRLTNSKGDPFGQFVSVVITVSQGGATATPTAGGEVTGTPTPEPETPTTLPPTPTETPKP